MPISQHVSVGVKIKFYEPHKSALTDHRFISRLCQMGLDADQLMYCPYGEEHPTYDRVRESGGEIPFCYHLDRQRNKTMADWLLPYLAKK